MTLNASGQISIGGSTSGQSINLELGRASTAASNLNESALRTLAAVPTGAIDLQDFYGKSDSLTDSTSFYVGDHSIVIKITCDLLAYGYVSNIATCGTAPTMGDYTVFGSTIISLGYYTVNNRTLLELTGNRAINFISEMTLGSNTLYTSALTDYGTDPATLPGITVYYRYYDSGTGNTLYNWPGDGLGLPAAYQTSKTLTFKD